jgi:hypothetical protein
MGKLKPPWIGNKEQRLLLSPESLEQGPAYRSTQQIFIVKWTDLLPWFKKKRTMIFLLLRVDSSFFNLF